MSEPLELKLLGRDYRVACGDDERETLLAAVALLEAKLAEFGKLAKGGSERIAVMAALDLAHELVVQRNTPAGAASALEQASIQGRINSIEARVTAALGQPQSQS